MTIPNQTVDIIATELLVALRRGTADVKQIETGFEGADFYLRRGPTHSISLDAQTFMRRRPQCALTRGR